MTLTKEQIAAMWGFPVEVTDQRKWNGEEYLGCRECELRPSHKVAFRVRGDHVGSSGLVIHADMIVSAEGHILAEEST